MELGNIVELLAQYGSVTALVLVVMGFVRGYVLSRGHHDEIVELWRDRLKDADSRCTDLSKENSELRQALVITSGQASRATSAAVEVVKRV